MNYDKTLNLPEKILIEKVNHKDIESRILEHWNKLKPFEKKYRQRRGGSKHIVYIYPSFLQGPLTCDKICSIVLGDLTAKYKALQGLEAIHLPIYGYYNDDNEDEGTEPDADKLERLISTVQSLGNHINWNKTLKLSNRISEREAINTFKMLYESGYLVRDPTSAKWCPRCQTELKDSELIYKNMRISSLYVKFPLMQGLEELGDDVSILVKIRTPWTLLEPRSVVCHPELTYLAVEIADEVILIAKSVLESNIISKPYRILREIKGAELSELVYSHPIIDRSSKLIFSRKTGSTGFDFVVSDDSSAKKGSEKPIIDENGKLSAHTNRFCGHDVLESGNLIIMELERRGYLLLHEREESPYPHCLYCDGPIVTRTSMKWFIDLDANSLRKRVLELVNKVNWSPKWIKERIVSKIMGMKGQPISLRRSRGVIIPAVSCNDCGFQVELSHTFKLYQSAMSSRKKLTEIELLNVLTENISCDNCGGEQFHLERESLSEEFVTSVCYRVGLSKQGYSGESILHMISFGQDESVLLPYIISMSAIDGALPFSSCYLINQIRLSSVKDISNEKMFNDLGADIVRLSIASIDNGKNQIVSNAYLKEIENIYKRVANICTFMIRCLTDFDHSEDKLSYDLLQGIDRWILHRLAKTYDQVMRSLQNSEPYKIPMLIYNFCSKDLSSTYISIVKRRLYASARWSSKRRSIQTALFNVLNTIIKLISPITPFLAEELWSKVEPGSSVFLSTLPSLKNFLLDSKKESEWDLIIDVRRQIINLLAKEGRLNKIGQQSAILYTKGIEAYEKLSPHIDELREIFMVSKVRLMPPDSPIPDVINDPKGNKDVLVELREAENKRCKRCRIYSDSVGTVKLHPELCDDCVNVLEGGTYYV